MRKYAPLNKPKHYSMKKRFLPLILGLMLAMTSQAAFAQSNWEAGLRFGDNFSLDATIPLAAAPRLHAAVYFTDDFGIGGYFDWMFALNSGPTGLKFYPGVGPEFIFANDFQFNIAGDFGAEYSFDFPLTIGFDWRPHFAVADSFKFRTGSWGFIARFRFGEGVSFKRTN